MTERKKKQQANNNNNKTNDHNGERYEKYSHVEFKTDGTDIFAAYRSNYICVVMSRACI